MPYHIYIPWLRENYFSKIENPKILEIGVDTGQTLLPIAQNFTMANLPFEYTGVDIRKDENLVEILQNFIMSSHHVIRYEIKNSLKWLLECKSDYDIILIDGDHNYKTVSEELSHLPRLLKKGGVAICDDFQRSKWANQDLYYSTRESHSNIEIATSPEKSEKVGVKNAIEDFISQHEDWTIKMPIPISEACVIERK